ncbi:hypothetical protein HK104_000559 [Borealophlyctis nickersoniae]|nr:hypothetical protein HK104_000559 [Borealophlyctis nickersoniae]
MSSLFEGNLSGTWLDAVNGISKHILGTTFTGTDKPYVRSRSLKHIQEALLFPGEKPLLEVKLDLGPKPRKVKQDVETLLHLVRLAKYIVEQCTKRDEEQCGKRDGMLASGGDEGSKGAKEDPSL